MSIPTVRIKSSHPEHEGYIIINESDFDKEVHEVWEEPKPAKPAEQKEGASHVTKTSNEEGRRQGQASQGTGRQDHGTEGRRG